jgi:hypothetical protein
MGLAEFFDISLERANDLYTWGWRLSAFGAVVTMIGVAALWMGTRVRDRDFETQMSGLNATTASTLERAGKLEREAAGLRLELDREVQKRAPRQLSDENASAFIAAIRGKIPAVTMFIESGWEPRRFAQQIEIALSQAGITIHEKQPVPNRAWPKEIAAQMVPFPPSNGAVMYAPGFTGNGAELTSDPLFKALTAAGIFGGGFNGPKLLDELNPDEHAIYIGEKAPW